VSVRHQHAALRLIREEELGKAGDGERVHDAGQDRQGEEENNCRSDDAIHVGNL